MTPNSTIIKYYQLISEGLLFYFLLVPVMVLFEHHSVPLWSYLLMVVVSIACLTVGERYVSNYSIYILSLFVLILFAIFVVQFPTLSGILLISFMTWRFIIHEDQPDLRNQMQMIVLMIIALFLDAIFFYDNALIWIALIMLVVVMGGYQLSHIVVEGSIGVKQALPFSGGFFAILLSGGLIVLSTYRVAQTVVPLMFSGLIKLVGAGIWWGLDLIGFTGLDIESLQRKIEGIASHQNAEVKMGEGKNSFITEEEMNSEYNPPDVFNWWTIGIAIVIVAVIIFFLVRRKFHDPGKDNKLERVSSETIKGEFEKQKSGGLFSRFSEKPTNEVRLKVFKFEQAATRKGIGRKQSETIEEWFRRIGIDASNLNVYQKIRYGGSELTEIEVNLFNQQLEEIKLTLEI